MKKVDFIPKTYIDEYMKKELYKDLNKHVIYGLKYDEDWKGTFKPLEFLNLLYEQFEVLTTNMDKPIAVLEHLSDLKLDKERLSFLLHYILKLIQEYATTKEFQPTEKQHLQDCYCAIKEELLNIKVKSFPLSEEHNQFIKNYPDLLAEEKPEIFFEDYPELFQENDSSILDELKEYLWAHIKNESSDNSTDNKKTKDGYGAKEWCTILYFTAYQNRKETDFDTHIVEDFHSEKQLPFAKKSFLANWKIVKKHILKSELQAIKLIETVLPYFNNDVKAKYELEDELSKIKDDLSRKEHNK